MSVVASQEFALGYLFEVNRNTCGCELNISVYIHGGCRMTVDLSEGSIQLEFIGNEPVYLMEYGLKAEHDADNLRKPLPVGHSTYIVESWKLVSWLEKFIFDHVNSVCTPEELADTHKQAELAQAAKDTANHFAARIKTAQFNPALEEYDPSGGEESQDVMRSDPWAN